MLLFKIHLNFLLKNLVRNVTRSQHETYQHLQNVHFIIFKPSALGACEHDSVVATNRSSCFFTGVVIEQRVNFVSRVKACNNVEIQIIK